MSVTKESLEQGKAAAMARLPLEDVQAIYTGRIAFERTAPRVIRVVKANETPAAKQQRLLKALFREYARDCPAEALEIVRQEVLDKRDMVK